MKKALTVFAGTFFILLVMGTTAYCNDILIAGADQDIYGKSATPYQASESNLAGRLNINTSTVEELVMLPGIGEGIAKNIISFRNANGPFNSVDDLIKVKGVGDKRLDALRPLIKLEGPSTLRIME